MPREHPSAGRIEVLDLHKSYVRRDGTRVLAVDDATLVVEPGEFLVLLGPSGCGKTTLLRAIAGLEPVQSGRINVHGTAVVDSGRSLFLPPEQRHVSMMFQSYALWPHKSVFDNVAYPLVARHVGKGERTARVERLLDAVGISQLARQFPSQISGGQQQRVALARALVADDGVVLFDEPLSNVDAKVREHLRTEILRLQAELGFTAVYVTHDQEEALMLASRLVVLKEGRIAQDAVPQEVYEHPVDSYVARFMGATNEMSAVLRDEPSGPVAVSEVLGDVRGVVRPETTAGRPVTVFSRPERWSVSADRPDRPVNTWAGVVAEVSFRGFYEDLVVAVGNEQVRVRRTGTAQHVAGDRVWLHLDPAFVHMVDEGLR